MTHCGLRRRALIVANLSLKTAERELKGIKPPKRGTGNILNMAGCYKNRFFFITFSEIAVIASTRL